MAGEQQTTIVGNLTAPPELKVHPERGVGVQVYRGEHAPAAGQGVR
jgi:single-stranded DNA-binding protein